MEQLIPCVRDVEGKDKGERVSEGLLGDFIYDFYEHLVLCIKTIEGLPFAQEGCTPKKYAKTEKEWLEAIAFIDKSYADFSRGESDIILREHSLSLRKRYLLKGLIVDPIITEHALSLRERYLSEVPFAKPAITKEDTALSIMQKVYMRSQFDKSLSELSATMDLVFKLAAHYKKQEAFFRDRDECREFSSYL
jgi:hypothetical protein